MAKTQVMSINEFMSGDYKQKVAKPKKETSKLVKYAVRGTALLPVAFGGNIKAFAQSPEAVEVSSTIASGTLDIIAHALDPVVELLVAISFPIASVVMLGSCFFFMFGNSEKAWQGITNGGMGYILIQLSPLFLKILKEIGNAI